MQAVHNEAVAVQPEQPLIHRHVPDEQLAVGQRVLRDGPRLYMVDILL